MGIADVHDPTGMGFPQKKCSVRGEVRSLQALRDSKRLRLGLDEVLSRDMAPC